MLSMCYHIYRLPMLFTVAGGTPSKAKTDVSDSMVGLGKADSAKAISLNQQSVGDGISEPALDMDKEDPELQEMAEDGEKIVDTVFGVLGRFLHLMFMFTYSRSFKIIIKVNANL